MFYGCGTAQNLSELTASIKQSVPSDRFLQMVFKITEYLTCATTCIKLRDHPMLNIRSAQLSLAILASSLSSILIISQQADKSLIYFCIMSTKKVNDFLALCQINFNLVYFHRYRFSNMISVLAAMPYIKNIEKGIFCSFHSVWGFSMQTMV